MLIATVSILNVYGHFLRFAFCRRWLSLAQKTVRGIQSGIQRVKLTVHQLPCHARSRWQSVGKRKSFRTPKKVIPRTQHHETLLGEPLKLLVKLSHTLIAVLGVFIIAGATIYFMRRPAPKEPIFAGRSLSEWCLDFDPGRPKRLTGAAQTALRSIGTNALPILIARATQRDEDFNQQVKDASFRYRWFHSGRFPGEFWDGVFGAFRALGPEAAGAIPALTECLTNSSWPGPADTSALALAAIGSPALPSLITALTCPSESARAMSRL